MRAMQLRGSLLNQRIIFHQLIEDSLSDFCMLRSACPSEMIE